jgi:hypothetical protein
MFAAKYQDNAIYEGEACGPYGYCSCALQSVICNTDLYAIPSIPNNTEAFNLKDHEFTVLPPQSMPPTLTLLAAGNNSLTFVPVPTPSSLPVLAELLINV